MIECLCLQQTETKFRNHRSVQGFSLGDQDKMKLKQLILFSWIS